MWPNPGQARTGAGGSMHLSPMHHNFSLDRANSTVPLFSAWSGLNMSVQSSGLACKYLARNLLTNLLLTSLLLYSPWSCRGWWCIIRTLRTCCHLLHDQGQNDHSMLAPRGKGMWRAVPRPNLPGVSAHTELLCGSRVDYCSIFSSCIMGYAQNPPSIST